MKSTWFSNSCWLVLPTMLFAISCITTFSSCEKVRGCTDSESFNYNREAEDDNGKCLSMAGCLGYNEGYSNSGSLGITLGDAFYDQKMNEEVYIQRNFFSGVSASVYILYEPSFDYKNAYASADGTILFGYYMFYYTVQNYGELPVAGILAHEWGHRAQFSFGWQNNNPIQELEADAFSGFYMALAKQWAWSQIQSYYANVYASGDYNFNSPAHHGTNNQRLNAAFLGVVTAIEAMENGTQYTYNDLHSLFITEIKNVILQSAKARFSEITYPACAKDKEYLKSLYPCL